MRRILFRLFSINIYAYPAFLYLGVVLGLIAGTYTAYFRGLDPVRTFAALLLLVLPALVGSRLLFVAANWNTFCHDPRRIWQNSDGGASLYGGLILAFLVSVPLVSALALPLGAFCDAAAITLLIGMVFTRVGCLLNGCCAGRPVHGPFSFCLPNHNGVWRRRLPTQILEGGLGALLLLGSVALWNYLPFDGALALANVAGYCIGRCGLEQTREDASIDKIGSVSVNRVIAAGLAVLAAACWLYLGLLEAPPSRGTISAAQDADMRDLSLWYFLTAPLAVSAVLLLFRFVGCGSILGLGDISYAATSPPVITSAADATFTEGSQGVYEVNTTGVPTPRPIKQIGLPPSLNLNFLDNGNGTATLSGIPAAGSSTGSPYSIIFTATNGNPPDATLPFTLTVNPPAGSAEPKITSPAATTFTEGVMGSFTVNTTGTPPPVVTQTGALPANVTFNNGTLSGTPVTGSHGSYPITFTASNGAAPDAIQNFTLTVNPPTPPSYSATVLGDNPVAYWPLHETNPPTSASGGTAVDLVGTSPGANPGTYVQPASPIAANPPSSGASPPYLVLGQKPLLASPSLTDFSVLFQGGCVQVPSKAALNPAVFTLEAVASPGWDLTQKGFYYSVLSSVGASAKTGFAVFAAPIGFAHQPSSDYHWMLLIGNGVAFAPLLPLGFTVNATGVLTYTGIVMKGTISTGALTTVTGLARTSVLSIGMKVSGLGIAAGTTIHAVGATSVTLSAPGSVGVNIVLTFSDPNRIGDPGPIVTKETTYLAFTYDGANYVLYIGTATRDQKWTTYQLVPPAPNYVPNTDPTNLFIGREDKTSAPRLFPFSGNLEEIAIYNVVLSTGRIASHGALAVIG